MLNPEIKIDKMRISILLKNGRIIDEGRNTSFKVDITVRKENIDCKEKTLYYG